MTHVDRMLTKLNRAIQADPWAITRLLTRRSACNSALAADPDVQVSSNGNLHTVSALGLICGLAGTFDSGWSRIAAHFEVECPKCGVVEGVVGEKCAACGRELTFGRVVEFTRIDPKGKIVR